MTFIEHRVEITSTELQKYLKRYQIAHPQMNDAEELTHAAIEERWPGMDHGAVALAAHANQLAADRLSMAREASSNQDAFIDTHAQGDLFNQYPVRIPKWFVIDGKPTEYWKVSIAKAMEFQRAREQALEVEADALEAAAREKRRMAKDATAQVEQMQRLIDIAIENGLDPDTVRFERADGEA